MAREAFGLEPWQEALLEEWLAESSDTNLEEADQ